MDLFCSGDIVLDFLYTMSLETPTCRGYSTFFTHQVAFNRLSFRAPGILHYPHNPEMSCFARYFGLASVDGSSL
jgi:hypothetical protein